MDEPGGADGGDEQIVVNMHVPEAMRGGVWANIARVAHSPYEFTLDFGRIDFAGSPPDGIVVARVNLSPLLVTQLIDALNANYQTWAEKAMPPEVRDDG